MSLLFYCSLIYIIIQIICSSYKVALCTEINEILLQNGFVSLSDLSSSFSLPLNFITKVNNLNIIMENALLQPSHLLQ